MWPLTLSYWFHLMTTIIWLGSITLSVVVALPAWRLQTVDRNQWLAWQQKLMPWVNGSMAVLWISGFYQMTQSEYYNGFLAIDNTWAVAMLIKHIAVIILMAIALYIQFSLHPALQRIALLAASKPKLAAQEQAALAQREQQLLRLNLILAVIILFFTSLAGAV